MKEPQNGKAAIAGLIIFILSMSWLGALADDTHQKCEAEWPDDYSMQVACINRQARGAQEYLDFVNRHNLTSDNQNRRRQREG